MIEEFVKYLKKDKKSEKTISLYIKVVEEFEEWYIKNHNSKFNKLKKSDVDEYIHYLEKDKNWKASTIKVNACILLKFSVFLLNYCI